MKGRGSPRRQVEGSRNAAAEARHRVRVRKWLKRLAACQPAQVFRLVDRRESLFSPQLMAAVERAKARGR